MVLSNELVWYLHDFDSKRWGSGAEPALSDDLRILLDKHQNPHRYNKFSLPVPITVRVDKITGRIS